MKKEQSPKKTSKSKQNPKISEKNSFAKREQSFLLLLSVFFIFPRSFFGSNFSLRRKELGNDPSAGSPTETLLRLLLPLNAQVWESSRNHRRREPPELQSKYLTKTFNR